jgi:carbamoyltransferase
MDTPEVIAGFGGLLSDAGCCVLKGGELASAVEQSKVARRERYEPFPDEAFDTALRAAGVDRSRIECIAIARPFSRGSESETLLALRSQFPKAEIVVVEHHTAHAASSYFVSGFENAAVLSADRAGDYRSAVLFEANGTRLTPQREMYFPDSIGDVFNRTTELLGYQSRSDEHKVQWLSTTAQPVYKDLFLDLLHRSGSSWPRIERKYLDSDRLGQGGFSRTFLNGVGLAPGEPVPRDKQAEIAASLQEAVNETVAGMIGEAENVCLAGGLGLNALLVASLESRFSRVFVQPAAGNAGTAIGAALHAWHVFYGRQTRSSLATLCLGPQYLPEEIKRVLENCKLRFRYLLTETELIEEAIRSLAGDEIVAWMHGRMEFGPRALGNRSILASPLNPYSTENLNVYIKHREAFRKFAASVPAELAGEYFEVGPNARFLASVGKVKPGCEKTFEAALLGGNLIRIHTVDRAENPLYHALLIETGKKTGLPVLYNTSFNLFGDPLVCTPRDAVRSFYSSGIDSLYVGNFVLEK